MRYNILIMTVACFLCAVRICNSEDRTGVSATVSGQVLWSDGDTPKSVPVKKILPKSLAMQIGEGTTVYEPGWNVNDESRGVQGVVIHVVQPVASSKQLMNSTEAIRKYENVFSDKNGVPLEEVSEALSNGSIDLGKVLIPGPKIECSNGQFTPLTLVVREGQLVALINKSTLPYIVVVPEYKTHEAVEIALKPNSLRFRQWEKQPPFYVRCRIHSWAKAQVFVFSHEYYAVTDAEGRFEITGLPVGDISLRARFFDYTIDLDTGHALKNLTRDEILMYDRRINLHSGKNCLPVARVSIKE